MNLRRTILFILVALLLPATLRAQSANDRFTTHARALDQYTEEYTAASLKDPANKGARRLSSKLSLLQNDVNAYRKGNLDRAFLLGRIEETQTEARRYRTSTAKKLSATLENLHAATKDMPKRMADGDAGAKQASAQPAAKTPAPAESGDLASAAPVEESAEDLADLGDESAATAAADEAALNSLDDTTTRSGGPSWVWGLALLVVAGAFGAVLYLQHRNLEALKAQVQARTGGNHEVEAGSDIPQRLAQTEANIAHFLQRAETRMAGIEDVVHKLSTHYGTLTTRLQQLEQGQGLAPVADAAPAEAVAAYAAAEAPAAEASYSVRAGGANGNGYQNGSSAQAYAAAATLAVTAPLTTAPHTASDYAELVGVLRNLAANSGIPQLGEMAKRMLGHYEPAASSGVAPEVSGAEIASLIQFAYLSATLEAQQEAYQHLTDFYRKEHVVAEDKMTGRMAFSDHYAENVVYDDFKRVAGNPAAEGPDFRRILDTVEDSVLLSEAVKNTVLYTRWPTVLRQQDGVKTVLQKGRYIVKG